MRVTELFAAWREMLQLCQQKNYRDNSLRANSRCTRRQDFPLEPTQSQGKSKTGECAECRIFGTVRRMLPTMRNPRCPRLRLEHLKLCIRQNRVLAMVYDAAIHFSLMLQGEDPRCSAHETRMWRLQSREAEEDDKAVSNFICGIISEGICCAETGEHERLWM